MNFLLKELLVQIRGKKYVQHMQKSVNKYLWAAEEVQRQKILIVSEEY